MPRKLFRFTAVIALLGLGMIPLFASQKAGMQTPAASQTDQSQKSLDAEMMSHQNEMQALIMKLQKSFQAVVDARDANGYVRDKSIVKAHEANITALRNAVRNHKLLLTADEGLCGEKIKQQDAMLQHQQQMKSVLYDVVDTFYSYQVADNSSIESSDPVEDALEAHRAALKELSDAATQHEKAMAQMMKKCS